MSVQLKREKFLEHFSWRLQHWARKLILGPVKAKMASPSWGATRAMRPNLDGSAAACSQGRRRQIRSKKLVKFRTAQINGLRGARSRRHHQGHCRSASPTGGSSLIPCASNGRGSGSSMSKSPRSCQSPHRRDSWRWPACNCSRGSNGRPQSFKSGREFAAWLGLVPRHTGTGRIRMLGISKRGDTYAPC